MRNAFIRVLTDLAAEDGRIWLLTADMGFSVFEPFAARFPTRYLNVGIAEATMIGVAAGLASCGYKVFVYSIVPFATMRCLEQIRVDVCYPMADVKIVGVGGGFSYGAQAGTHHSVEDVAIMRSLPGMCVMSPGDPVEAEACVRRALAVGPAYIRLGKTGEPVLHRGPIQSDTLGMHRMRAGRDIALLATGSQVAAALTVADNLDRRGISAEVWSVPLLKPVPSADLKVLATFNRIYTLEEHSVIGGLGSMVAEWLARHPSGACLHSFGVQDCFATEVGSQAHLLRSLGLAPDDVSAEILQDLGMHMPTR